MPKSRSRQRAQPATIDTEVADDLELDTGTGDDEQTGLNALESIDAGAGARITVSRHREERGQYGPKLAFCFSCDVMPGPALMDTIAQRSGPGDYTVRLVRQNGTYAKSIVVAVDGVRESHRSTALVPAPAPAAMPSLDPNVAALLQSAAEDRRLLSEFMRNRPETDNLAMFERFATIMGTMRAAPAEASGAAMIGTIREAMTLARDMGGAGVEKTTGLWDVIRAVIENPQIIDAVKAVAENMQAQTRVPVRPAAPPPRAIAAAPVASPPMPAASPPMAAGGDDERKPADPHAMVQQYLQTWVPLLVIKAKADGDPALYAELVLDNMPPDLVRIMINQPGFLDALTQQFPDIATSRQWFDELLAEMKKQTQDAGENEAVRGEGDGPGAAGDAAGTHS